MLLSSSEVLYGVFMSQQPTRRVLIVDDEPAVREMLAVALEMAGFEVREADCAQTALAEVTARIPDLMLIDWMMPNVSALSCVDVCVAIKTPQIFRSFSLRHGVRKMRKSPVSKSLMTTSPNRFHRESSSHVSKQF